MDGVKANLTLLADGGVLLFSLPLISTFGDVVLMAPGDGDLRGGVGGGGDEGGGGIVNTGAAILLRGMLGGGWEGGGGGWGVLVPLTPFSVGFRWRCCHKDTTLPAHSFSNRFASSCLLDSDWRSSWMGAGSSSMKLWPFVKGMEESPISSVEELS